MKPAVFDRTPFPICVLRLVHALLALYAAAIIAVAFFSADSVLPWFTDEVVFAVMVAAPVFLASVFSFAAAAMRALFGTAIFCCSFLALALAGMPLMATMFFPAHLTVFALALVYGLTALTLARYYFSLPVPKKR